MRKPQALIITGDIFFNLIKQPVPLIMKGENLRDVRYQYINTCCWHFN